MAENPLSKRNDIEKKKRWANSVRVLTSYFNDWRLVHPSHEVSKAQLAVYLKDLDDLSPTELEIGCREASRVAEQFPKPGHIRKALQKAMAYREELLGPPRLEYAPISQEEREEALKYSEALKKKLAITPAEQRAEARRVVKVFPPPKPIEQQKRELREKGYLR